MFIRVILSRTFTLVLENEIDYEYEFSNQFGCLRKLIITSSLSLFFIDVVVSYRKELLFRGQLFEGRLALNSGLSLTRVSFSCVQKHFLG